MSNKETLGTNNNILYIGSSVAHKKQIVEAIIKTLTDAGLSTQFKISFVVRNGEYCGYAYVWIEDTQVFRDFCGIDDKGNSEKVSIRDPNWLEPAISKEECIAEIYKKWPENTLNWSDISERSEAIDKMNESYTPGMVTVPKYAKLKLSPYEYTSDQIEHWRKLAEQRGRIDDCKTHGDFIVGEARVPANKLDVQQNVLYCQNLPTWIQDTDLKRIFEPYASDSTTKHKRTAHKESYVDTYPFVTLSKIKGKQKCYIIFDPNTIDGRMCIMVNRKLTVVNRILGADGVEKLKSSTMIFNHPKLNY